jgi:hypothetical protein
MFGITPLDFGLSIQSCYATFPVAIVCGQEAYQFLKSEWASLFAEIREMKETGYLEEGEQQSSFESKQASESESKSESQSESESESESESKSKAEVESESESEYVETGTDPERLSNIETESDSEEAYGSGEEEMEMETETETEQEIVKKKVEEQKRGRRVHKKVGEEKKEKEGFGIEEETLKVMKRPELYLLCQQFGVVCKGTNLVIVENILAAQQQIQQNSTNAQNIEVESESESEQEGNNKSESQSEQTQRDKAGSRKRKRTNVHHVKFVSVTDLSSCWVVYNFAAFNKKHNCIYYDVARPAERADFKTKWATWS